MIRVCLSTFVLTFIFWYFLQMVLEVLQTVTEEQRALDEQIARLRATSRSNEDRLRGCEELVLSRCLCS